MIIRCSGCGAALNIPEKGEQAVCRYCGSVNVFNRSGYSAQARPSVPKPGKPEEVRKAPAAKTAVSAGMAKPAESRGSVSGRMDYAPNKKPGTAVPVFSRPYPAPERKTYAPPKKEASKAYPEWQFVNTKAKNPDFRPVIKEEPPKRTFRSRFFCLFLLFSVLLVLIVLLIAKPFGRNTVKPLQTAAKATARPLIIATPNLEEAAYRKGKALEEGEFWEEAAQQYEKAGKWADSRERAEHCRYLYALQLRENGNVDGAIAQLEKAGQNALQMMKNLYYEKAKAYLEAGNWAGALSALKNAEGPGLQEMLKQAHWLQGKNLLQQGKAEEALQAFRNASGYADADALAGDICMEQARQLLESGKTSAALEILAPLKGPEAEALMRQVHYVLGKKAYQIKNWETAADELQAAGDTEDAPELLEKACKERDAEREKARKQQAAADWGRIEGELEYGNKVSAYLEYAESVENGIITDQLGSSRRDKKLKEGKKRSEWFTPGNTVRFGRYDPKLMESFYKYYNANTPISVGVDSIGDDDDYPRRRTGKVMEWLVLDREGERALLLAKTGLFVSPNHSAYQYRSEWRNSWLKIALDNYFRFVELDRGERGVIRFTDLDRQHSESAASWNRDTGGWVFALSGEECRNYLPDAESRKALCFDEDGKEIPGGWWLRAEHSYVDENGEFRTDAADDDYYYARPAIWVYLDSDELYEYMN